MKHKNRDHDETAVKVFLYIAYVVLALILLIAIARLIARFDALDSKDDITVIENATIYKGNTNLFAFSTSLSIQEDGEEYGQVKGKMFSIVKEPLTLYDTGKNEIAFTSDESKFMEKNAHTIYINDRAVAEMVGKTNYFGGEYEVLNSNKEKIGSLTFDSVNCVGEFQDSSGNVLATYYSNPFSMDFEIKISKDSEWDNRVILMMFCARLRDYNSYCRI